MGISQFQKLIKTCLSVAFVTALHLSVAIMPARAQQVVLAFEDVLGPSASLDGMARTRMLIGGLRREGVEQALFFVKTKKIDTKTKLRLIEYDKAGHLLASHGHDDNLLKKVNLYAYQLDLLKSQALLDEFSNYRGYFRSGYYSGGSDMDLRRKLQAFAHENNLQPTYVTLKSFDWYLNQQYLEQVNSNRRVDMAALEKVYVEMIWLGLETYQQQVMPTAGVNAKHVLLLQENDLAGYFIAALIEKIRAEGWGIVSPDAAFGYPKISREPVSVQTSAGYIKALTGMSAPIVEVPMLSHKSTEEIDAILQANQLFF